MREVVKPLIFIDIETRPPTGWTDEQKSALVKPPGNYRKQETIDRYILDHREEAYRRLALDPMLGEVLCVGVAIEDDDPIVIYEDTEQKTLETLWRGLEGRVGYSLVGHNLVEFDLPFIARRALRHGLDGLCRRVWCSRRYGSPMFIDTLVHWRGPQFKARGSLTAVCEFLRIERLPDQLMGGQVFDAVRAGDRRGIIEHCMDDVKVTREVYRRLRAGGIIL